MVFGSERETVRRIDLTVPTAWNQCSTAQLETVVGVYLRQLAEQDRYHPFDAVRWKTEVFVRLAGLEVIGSDTVGTVPAVGSDAESERTTEGLSPSVSAAPQETIYTVRLRDRRRWWQRIWPHTGDRPSVTSQATSQQGQSPSAPFPLRDWELLSFVDGQMKWMDSFTDLLIFPYPRYGWPIITLRWVFNYLPLPWLHVVRGPAELLQDFSWHDYRMCQQWLDLYVETNSYVASLQGEQPTADILQQLKQSREQFLTALFRSRSYLDIVLDTLFDRQRPLRRLRRMPDVRFQLCLIFWQSMMHYYKGKFPRCFKEGGGRSQRDQTPLDLYTRSTATLQKYIKKTEAEINAQPFYVILQHLEDMAHEAEEMERISRRNKSKH